MKTIPTHSVHFAPVRIAMSVAFCMLATCNAALADCAAASVSEVKAAFARARNFESQGKHEAALGAYVHAQEYTCERNPVEAEAAQRAAALSLPLASAAEQRSDFERAFRLYDDGGHFAKADAALIQHLRRTPDEPSAFERARSHFETRALESFQSNNAIRLKLTGPYRVNPAHVAEVLSLPAKGVERALQQEAAAFDEQYLRDRVQLTQSRPDSLSDGADIQSAMTAQQAFIQKWPADLIKRSRKSLGTLRQWGVVTRDAELAKSVERAYAQRIESHIDAITLRFNGAPELLEEAIDYVDMLHLETVQSNARAAKIKIQAVKLGDSASAQQRLALASEYYRVGGDEAKAQAAQARMRDAAMAKMQPSIDEMQRQAARIQAQYADPEAVKAMQAQAEAMRKSLQQSQGAKQGNAKRAAELESELGL